MLVSKRSRATDEIGSKIDSDRWDIVVQAAHASYPATNLKTDDLNQRVRTWGQRQSHTQIEAWITGSPDPQQVDYVAVLGINRAVPNRSVLPDIEFQPNKARLIIDRVLYAHEPVVTSVGFTLTNLTGAHSVLNQVFHPAEEAPVGYTRSRLQKVDNALDTEIIIIAEQYSSASPRPFTGQQTTMFLVRDSVDVETFPTITTTLRQNSVDIAVLPYDSIEQTSEGYIYTYVWDATLLPGTDNVGFKVHGETLGTSTVEYITFAWHAGVSGTVYDSGWNDLVRTDQVVWRVDVEMPAGTAVVVVQFSDFGYRSPIVVDDPFTAGTVGVWGFSPFNSEPFVAGRFLSGDGYILDLPEQGGIAIRKETDIGSLRTRGGSWRGNRNALFWSEYDFRVILQAQSVILSALEDLYNDNGNRKPLLIIPDETEPDLSAIYVILTRWDTPDAGSWKSPAAIAEPYYELSFSAIDHKASRAGE